MRKVGSREFKNRQGYYLRQVHEGESLLVTVRGKPVARVSPPGQWDGLSVEEVLDELERQGHVRKARLGRLRPIEPIPLRGKPLSQIIVEDRG